MVFLVFPKNKLRVRLGLVIVLVLVMLLLFQWVTISQSRDPWSKNDVKNYGKSGAYDDWTQTKDLPLERSYMNVDCNSEVYGNEMCPIHYNSLSSCDLFENTFVCPDIRSQVNGTVRQAQLVTIRMLRMLDCIASKYGLRYWLEGDSILGAYRHEGCVPWVIGIDVGIYHKDVLKFIKIFSELETPGTTLLGQLDSAETSKFEVITKSTPGLNKVKYLQLRDENSCYKKCSIAKCKWMGGLSVSIRVSSHTKKVFPLRRLSFEGWFFPVPCKVDITVQSQEYLNALKYPKSRRPNLFVDPFHSCNELS